jgi:transcriptional regulator GlxA family with amidase domain
VFNLRFVGAQPNTRSSVGAQIAELETLPTQLNAPSWIVLLGYPDEAHNKNTTQVRKTIQWLRSLASELQTPNRLITICAGALLAARAGLLINARVATHHLELEKLKQIEPRCEVQANRVFVLDESCGVYSSAGITTGIDLAVHLIAQTCGEAVAVRVAQVMVLPLRRGPNDPELSPFLQGRAHMHAGIHKVQDAIANRPLHDWTITSMAKVACTTPRHLARLFAEHVAMTPLTYLQNLRLACAEKALSSGLSVTQAAQAAGFNSDTQLRRAWARSGREGSPSQFN